ncbi:MAG: pyridoxamine 5'-phosphate oxidase family protein, partial [Eudoraea sp.]|nr:pyridoxamine 5'-phosphate oxidase family protein [Eudoraea sp.]
IDLVQTSCGFGVPYMKYVGERDQLGPWAEEKGKEGIEMYWEEKNVTSLDGHPTGIFEKNSDKI